MGMNIRLSARKANPNVVSESLPDFTGGLCTLRTGRHVAERGMNTYPSVKGMNMREQAKMMCNTCPLEQRCRKWVLDQESPAGSWPGVWGGLDPWDRQGLELVIRRGKVKAVPYVID